MGATSHLYLLDTNTVSYLIKGQHQEIRHNLLNVPMSTIAISVITEAELLLGVAKKPDSKHLPLLVKEFLLRVTILPWDSAAASYARLRASCEREGKPLGTMDMLIAAHCKSVNCTLITNDKAFYNIAHKLSLQDWTKPVHEII